MNTPKTLSLLFLFSCTTLGLAGGCSSDPSPGEAPTAATPTHEEWRQTMSKIRAPRAGCFQAAHPSTTWVEVPCGHGAPLIPLTPRRGHGGGNIVGDAVDFSAQAVGTISWATGTFPVVSGVASEFDSFTGQPDSFSLQLNSNPFGNAPQCAGAAVPAKCQGWEQFVYASDWLFIQYWLLDYGNACPSGWTPFENGPQLDCYRNSNNQWHVGVEKITNLQNLSMTATADTTDAVQLLDKNPMAPMTFAISEPSLMNLAAGWTGAEYNVFGNGNGSQANFNDGSSIDVVLQLDNVPITPYAPACEPVGFTGETNNLNLETPCCAVMVPPGTAQGIRFTEATTTLTQPTQQCPLYLNVNNSPLLVTQGGTSEAYILMYGPWISQDHGSNATGVVVANDAPGVTIQVAPGTVINTAGAVNLTVTAPLTAPVGSYQASVQVTDLASGISSTATVPIDVLACQPPPASICTAGMCGIWNASSCGGVDCGSCGTGVCSSGHCCPTGSFYNGTTCQPTTCPTGTSWCANAEACLTAAQCNPTCPPTKPLCPATDTCLTPLMCNKVSGGGGGGCKGTNCM